MTDTIKFKRPNLRRTRAFSLAELMIATGILGIGMIIVAMAFPVALDQSRLAVETTTSQAVFNEAVNKLKTQVKWTEIERYINPGNGNGEGALESVYRLGIDDHIAPIGNRIYLLSFDTVSCDTTGGPITRNFFGSLSSADCTYSIDNTYGWVAAVQKISNQTYKFWIFILREPTGITMEDTTAGIERLKFRLVGSIPQTVEGTGIYKKQLDFEAGNDPSRDSFFIDENGKTFKITEISSTNSGIVMCNREVNDGITAVNLRVAHAKKNPEFVTNNLNVQITRKNPVVAVFETVISY